MLMKKQLVFLASAVFCLASVCGCKGKPSGFPSVKPCKIVVTNGSTPIAGVAVALVPQTPISGATIGGMTDEKGVCVVQTVYANYAANGAPEGQYVVTLSKQPDTSEYDLSEEEQASMSRQELEEYYNNAAAEIANLPTEVPANLSNPRMSSISISVPDESERTIDVSQF